MSKPAQAEPVRNTFGGMPNSRSGCATAMPARPSNLQRVSTLNSTPATAHSQNTSGLKVGAIVEHDRFGVGTVTSLDGTGDNAKAVVDFTNAGLKTLLLRFAKITIVS
jgi:DNA helicase-2/ATP-dependent DNA helicase PcrA